MRANILYGLERMRFASQSSASSERNPSSISWDWSGFEDSYPSQLPGGMRQRTAIARTLAFDPKILLMDEPFGALDAQTRSLMQSELLSIWQRTPKTVIFVTHDVQEAVYLADRVAVMSARPGRVKAIVETRFDKARSRAIFKNKGFIDKVDEIWNLVRIEAIKAQGRAGVVTLASVSWRAKGGPSQKSTAGPDRSGCSGFFRAHITGCAACAGNDKRVGRAR